jgi:hypothetical protein
VDEQQNLGVKSTFILHGELLKIDSELAISSLLL